MQRDATIPAACKGQRVDAALAFVFPEFSRSKLTQWLKEGAITLNGKQYKPKDKVIGEEHAALLVTLPENTSSDQAEAIPLDIIFEEEDFLVINKPAGLVVHPGAGNRQHTLVNALLHYHAPLAQLPRAGIIHRLDKDTTGLLIVAKTLPAHTHLTRQMQAREIHRHYLALVHGHLISGGTIDTGFGRHTSNRLKMAVTAQGRQAITHYRLKKQFQHVTLLDVELMTGRTHQIRVHMAHINHPIVGDPLYGGRARFPRGADDAFRACLSQFKRQALHAYSLSLHHPSTMQPLTCIAPIPDDFQQLITALETHDIPKR